MGSQFRVCVVTGLALLLSASDSRAAVIVNDPLQGSTIGTRSGGTFAGGGWKVTNTNDYIYWHIPTLTTGVAEFDVSGINPNECRPDHEDKSELYHMYDYNFGNADTVYNGGYRDSPHKHFVRKTNCLDPPRVNSCELLWQILPAGSENYTEPDTAVLAWSPAATYHFKIEWSPSGGNSQCKVYRDGTLHTTMVLAGSWNPSGHSVRIAASPRAPIASDFGAPLDAVFSNFLVQDGIASIPGAPTITAPTNAETLNTTIAYVQWNGDSHSKYQMRINTQNASGAGIIYDSQEVTSDDSFAWSGALANNATYYAFVRLGTTAGWGPWSTGRQFAVNTSYVPPGADVVTLKGATLAKNSGPFNGLGFSYMSALRRCKYDRPRFQSDLAFMASNEFQYMRALSMVGWYSAWQGKEIAPVSFTSQNGTFVPAWPDYWQQLRDMIDIAYDSYGIRTELTIFADAQLMPNKPNRITHMQTILDNLPGREHKIMHLEVANEAWQNGFPGSQGVADLREFCQYLTDRTSLLVGISATPFSQSNPNATLIEMYAGSTADIATEHFDRDIGTIEGGWFPVREPWRCDLAAGVPPCSHNEPIGPGSSVAAEFDPIKLVMGAAHAWGVGLPLYVFHSDAGVFGDTTFQSRAGVGSYIHIDNIMPPDIASWVRNDGKETVAAFTSYSNGQANKWWPEVGGATNGCVRNTGKIKGGEFVTVPIGILNGGLTLQSRRPMQFQVYNPLTGAVAYNLTKNTGEQFTLAQGPGAYIIKGIFTDILSAATEVSIDLGSPDVEQGISHPQNADGDTVPFTIGGRTGRKNVNSAEDLYYYFNVSDAFAFQGSKPDVYVVVDYYDTGTNSITLQYDATSTPYQVAASVPLTNTNTWMQAIWHVTDAYFGNRQNAGADFRIATGGGNTFYLDLIVVTTQIPGPPVIAEVSPDPQLIYPGLPYTQQLTLTAGSPAPTWSVVNGPAGLQVNASGLVTGWTPSAVGDYTLQIQATNAQGSDTETWVVRVLSLFDFDFDGDADLADFGHLQRCLSGDGVAYGAGCDDADANSDGDVDTFDFNSFLPCMAGSDLIPGC